MRIEWMIRMPLGVSILVGAMAAVPPPAVGQNADSVQLRNECRLAHQILTKGQPANQRDWALEFIRGCGSLGGEAIAHLIRSHRGSDTWNAELDRIVDQTAYLVDLSIFEAGLEVAIDPSAGLVARVQGLRAMRTQLSPGDLITYDGLVDPLANTRSWMLEVGAHFPPLPEEAYIRAEEAMRALLDVEELPDPLRAAAKVVLPGVVARLYCEPGMTLAECFTIAEAKLAWGNR